MLNLPADAKAEIIELASAYLSNRVPAVRLQEWKEDGEKVRATLWLQYGFFGWLGLKAKVVYDIQPDKVNVALAAARGKALYNQKKSTVNFFSDYHMGGRVLAAFVVAYLLEDRPQVVDAKFNLAFFRNLFAEQVLQTLETQRILCDVVDRRPTRGKGGRFVKRSH